MANQKLIFTNSPAEAIDRYIDETNPPQIFVLTDSNTSRLVYPRIAEKSRHLKKACEITIGAGDVNKSLESLASIWSALGNNGGTRRSLMINAGGGVITDIGGFAAATFKRGIRFINVPTTLLSAVDAAVGGKTGINFNGLKNEIGVFREADAVIISTCYYDTLPQTELRSGYAEMLKHGLISDRATFEELLQFDIAEANAEPLLALLEKNVMVKKRIVEEDPLEHGLRRALNLGHTPAHAFESWAMAKGKPVPHGYAVAWGLVVDLILSHMSLGFPSGDLHKVATFVERNYGPIGITCNDYPQLLEYMRHDKKNASVNEITFSLLEAPGKVKLGHTATPDEISVALDIFRDLMHI